MEEYKYINTAVMKCTFTHNTKEVTVLVETETEKKEQVCAGKIEVFYGQSEVF